MEAPFDGLLLLGSYFYNHSNLKHYLGTNDERARLLYTNHDE